MRRIDALLADYGSYHRTRGNLTCHKVGITLILFGLLSMLHTISVLGLWTASELAIAAGFLYYLTLYPVLAFAILAAAALLDLTARSIGDGRVGAAAFVVGWLFQAIGHAIYEKNSPAFFKNLLHLMTGPIYLANEALHIRPAAGRSE